MTDKEFEIIDELYFLSSFDELQDKLAENESELKNDLRNLLEKGWVKCLIKESDQEVQDFKKFDLEYKKYNYLVSKAGLFAHNSR